MDDLKKLSLTELKGALESVNKAIKAEEDFLGEVKSAYMQDRELWVVHGTKLTKVKEIINGKTDKPVYNENQIMRVKRGIDDLKILNKRRNNIIIEIKRREWGNEFFDNLKLYDLKQKGTEVIYHNKGSMREFLMSLIKDEKHKYILMNKIRYNDERIDDKKYIVYALLVSKPKGDYNKIEAGEIIIDGLIGGIASAERELWRRIDLQKPEPIKTYNNIDLLENLNNPEKRLIREIEKETEVNDYKLVVEKGDNNRVNYLLYDSEKYHRYIISLEKILLDICKEWNDEEYLRIIIDLNSWKRKEKSSSTDGMSKSLSEIYGKYELWYVENNLEPPELDKMILRLRGEIVRLVSKILETTGDIEKLRTETDKLESKFDNDIDKFPSDLLNELEKTERELLKKESLIKDIEIILWGVTNQSKEGMIWKHDRLVLEFKKIKLGDDELFEKLSEKSTKKQLQKIENQIMKILSGKAINVDEYELNKLSLEVLGKRLSNEEQFYEEILHPEKTEENQSAVINDVLKENYNLDVNNKNESRIRFATPRTNRDTMLIELNHKIAKLEEQKVLNRDNVAYLKQVDEWLEGHKKEAKELSIHLIGDVLLSNNIKDMVRKEIETSKNNTGLSYLGEIDYVKIKNYLIEEGSGRIFNMITNNEYEKKLDDIALLRIINEEIQKVLPELDKRFMNVKQSNKTGHFKELWEQIVDSNFKTDTIIKILDEVGYDNEDEFIEYMKRMFKRRTLDEWIKYYDMEDKISQIERLKKENLPPEIESQNSLRITNAKYEESTIGQYTLQNLNNFKIKYLVTTKQEMMPENKSTTKQVEDKPLINKRKKILVSNEVIAEEVVKRWDDGLEEYEEIYKILSIESENIFGEILTPGQIKGKYQRHAYKNKEFKRKKY